MRMLLWHCKEVAYDDIKASDRPKDVHTYKPAKGKGYFQNVLLVFCCIERRDNAETPEEAADIICDAEGMLHPKGGVLLVPFAHLSSQLARPGAARRNLERTASLLADRGLSVNLTTFGFHKHFRLRYEAYGHPGSVEFREIPAESRPSP